MNYEQKYKESLERARKIHNDTEFDYEKGMMEEVFPELSESEDESMMKVLLRGFKNYAIVYNKFGGVDVSDIIAWLEKQKNTDVLDKEEREFADNVDSYRKDMDEFYKKGYNAGREAEKQYWLEKQGEQNPTNEVKPKFHEGDWVACEGLNTAKIISIEGNRYELELLDGDKVFSNIDYIDRIFHLWTIQDARDGDVLYIKYDKDEWVIIFSSMNPEGYIIDHCSYCINNEFYSNSTPWGKVIESDIIHPATKEQCDLLFSKMEEKGYWWNAEYKQLNNIES